MEKLGMTHPRNVFRWASELRKAGIKVVVATDEKQQVFYLKIKPLEGAALNA